MRGIIGGRHAKKGSLMGSDTISSTERIHSIDALRGFDMFWIIGGGSIVVTLAESTNFPLLRAFAGQLTHVEWHGFRCWDLIFPLFLFLAGVSMPFSLSKRRERGDSRRKLVGHVVRRGLTLVFLGLVYNGFLRFDFEELRCASVLGRIGLGYLGAGCIFIFFGVRGQALWIGVLLLGYFAALSWIPVPGFGAGDLSPGATLTDYLDRQFLPGRLHREVRDPEGLLSTIPAIGTGLLGALAGSWLRSDHSKGVKAGRLILVGGIVALCGVIFGWAFPINKNLWTSSFVLLTGGISAGLLGIFYLIIDVWGYRKWAFVFVVIGMNPITIYLLQAFVDFDGVSKSILAGSEGRIHPVFWAGTGLLLKWCFLYCLYRKRIFLRV